MDGWMDGITVLGRERRRWVDEWSVERTRLRCPFNWTPCAGQDSGLGGCCVTVSE